MQNELAAATSPYLQQHKDNPVAWVEWSPATLARAAELDRPILLSVGYAACHWCHVMAHESFEKPEVAALMNAHFVNVKVDREERPDLDAIYQHALALLGEHGGWPLTMFLTPAGEPFWGGTYFPPEPRHGRPGFPQVLETIDRIWRTERHKVTSNRAAIMDSLARLGRPEGGEDIPAKLPVTAARDLAEQFDTIHGGLAGAPKFPQAPMLALIWQQALVTRDPLFRRRVTHTLGRISQGGIYDHVGGGYSRYAVDAYWLVPHFEKMLYDNGQLLGLLASVWTVTRDPLLEARSRETVAWLEREMLNDGAFAASLDADSEGEEGRFYVWSAAEIDSVLGADAPLFRLAYGVTGKGNWEGHNVLNRLHDSGLPPEADEPVLARCRQALLAHRAARIRPGTDDKVLADWNGMMIQGLAAAAGTFGQPAWLALARGAFSSVVAKLGDGDRLYHSWRDGRRLELSFLDDYAQMGRAAIALYEQTGDDAYLARATSWLERVELDHRDPSGGYFMTAGDAGDVLIRAKNAHDGPSPAGNATLLTVLEQMALLTGDPRYAERATGIVTAFAGEVRRNPLAHSALLEASAWRTRAAQIVLVGDPQDPALLALHRAASQAPMANRLIAWCRDGHALPESHPAHGKAMIHGLATAYLCVGTTCLAPVTDTEGLTVQLAGLPAMQASA